MPNMPDERFARAVIYVCAHSESGAMGLVINRVAEDLSLGRLLARLNLGDEVEASAEADTVEGHATSAHASTEVPDVIAELADTPIFVGGPVETKRGFVLHSSDYYADGASVRIGQDICLTATVDILQAIARGEGPDRSILALGYAGWGSGQLERELQANSWLHADSPPADLIFATDVEDRYDAALGLIGIDPSFLVASAGRA